MDAIFVRRPPAGATALPRQPSITVDPATADHDSAILRIDSHPAFLTAGTCPDATEHNVLAHCLARVLHEGRRSAAVHDIVTQAARINGGAFFPMPLTPAAVIAEIDANHAALSDALETLMPNLAAYILTHASAAMAQHQRGDAAGYRRLLLDLATVIVIELARRPAPERVA